jgi:hypothetical protein
MGVAGYWECLHGWMVLMRKTPWIEWMDEEGVAMVCVPLEISRVRVEIAVWWSQG